MTEKIIISTEEKELAVHYVPGRVVQTQQQSMFVAGSTYGQGGKRTGREMRRQAVRDAKKKGRL